MFLLLLACAPPDPLAAPTPTWPSTPSRPVTETIFGVELTDPYRWLEDETQPEVQDWMDQQDRYARSYLEHLPRRAELASRFQTLYQVDAVSTPVLAGRRIFYLHQPVDREKSMLVYREGDGPEVILLDPNTFSADGSVSLGRWFPSNDGSKVAFTRNPNHSDEAILYTIDVASGAVTDEIPGARYASPSWTPDNQGFYYERLPMDSSIPEDQRPGYTEIYYHRLGTDLQKDPLIHPATHDPQTFLDSSLSFDGRTLFFYVYHGWNAVDVYQKEVSAPLTGLAEPRPLVVGRPFLYSVVAHGGRFYIWTDEGAPKGRVMVADASDPQPEKWKELIPEDTTATLESIDVVGGHLVLAYLKDVRTVLKLASLDGLNVREVPLPTLGTANLPSGQPDQDTAWFVFSSYTVPNQIYQLSIKENRTSLWAHLNVPVDPSQYEVEQVFYTSRDGTRIPMFLVHRKGLQKNGRVPTLLYGYGGFEISMTPWFLASILPWLDAGGMYAVANIRGGGEYGKAWHEAGMGEKKQNVYDDFIAAGEYLIHDGWTQSRHLGIKGGSNGGLLVGAVMTQRPDLWGAVVCQVPLLDMLRYHLFGSGRTWIPEYGSAENEAEFRNLLSWSPYQKVRKGTAYPALLMLSSDHDDRVDPNHARKFVAAVQNATSRTDRPVLLRVERHAGHGGADSVSQDVAVSADSYAFLFDQLTGEGTISVTK